MSATSADREGSALVVIGKGLIGNLLFWSLGQAGSLHIGARELEDWLPAIDAALRRGGGTIIFAHGAPVDGVQWFGRYASRRRFDALLGSREGPVRLIAEKFGDIPRLRVLLTSSTVADSRPAKRGSLGDIQRRYEKSFEEAFPHCNAAIIRVGTLMAPEGQFPTMVGGLSRTLLLKRLRPRTNFRIRCCSSGELINSVSSTLISGSLLRYAVDHEISFNDFLGNSLNVRSITIPSRYYLAIFGLLGMPADFFLCRQASIAQPFDIGVKQ